MVGSRERSPCAGGSSTFSRRDGSPGALELEGDTIDSIRAFDPETQRSTGTVDSVEILPVVERPSAPKSASGSRSPLLVARPAPGHAEARSWLDRVGGSRPESTFRSRGARTDLPERHDRSDDVGARCAARGRRAGQDERRAPRGGRRAGDEPAAARPGCPLPGAGEIVLDTAATLAQLKRADLRLTELRVAGEAAATFASQPARNYGGRVLDFLRDVAAHRAGGRGIVAFMSSRGTRERLGEILTDYG
jgi:hypothetical protein